MLSTFPMGENRSTRRKPTTYGRALTILFSHEDRVQVHIKMNLTGDGTRNLRSERRVVWPLQLCICFTSSKAYLTYSIFKKENFFKQDIVFYYSLVNILSSNIQANFSYCCFTRAIQIRKWRSEHSDIIFMLHDMIQLFFEFP